MVNNHLKTPRLKPLLDRVPPGFLVDTAWLKDQQIDSKSIHQYVSSGWFERVIRGVYRRPLPLGVQDRTAITWQGTLLSLQRILRYDVYLGGVSALDFSGFYHFVRLGGSHVVHFYGNAPSWLKRLPLESQIVLHRNNLFGEDNTGVVNSDSDSVESTNTEYVWRWPIRVSTPERATLEALDGLKDQADFDLFDKTFEMLTTLRPIQLMQLLVKCRSVKVRRLFFVFADRHRHAWHKQLDASKIDLGSGPRALVKGGAIHPTYRIYVPRDFALAQVSGTIEHG